ncbi:MAG: outer membrane protein assembly factor BamE [Arenicellales bacterium]
MIKTARMLILAAAAAAMAGCAFFRVEIQQGNYITKEQVAQLKEGMTKREVRYVMGTPLVVDPFHAKDRWDYVYAYSPNLGTNFKKHRVTLFFKDDKLDRIAGDVSGKDLAQADQYSGGTRVTSPTAASKQGFFSKIFHRNK